MIICLCNNISEKEIEDAIERGSKATDVPYTWDVRRVFVCISSKIKFCKAIISFSIFLKFVPVNNFLILYFQ